MILEDRIYLELTRFPWHNYRLDIVNDPDTSDEWARELTENIAVIVRESVLSSQSNDIW